MEELENVDVKYKDETSKVHQALVDSHKREEQLEQRL